MKSTDVARSIKAEQNKKKAKMYARFFKTGKGEYGEDDVFLGLTVPQQRTIAKQYKDLPLKEIEILLHSTYHEFRLVALLILVLQYEHGDEKIKKSIAIFYTKQFRWINNWDLVDLSAYKILGDWLRDKDKAPLSCYAQSTHLWTKRIAIVATYACIRHNHLDDTFTVSEILLHDEHDLIHKAVGWMLREAGKKDVVQLERFLKKHYMTMPRTMLRYAIEKFWEEKRQRYLKGMI